MVGLIRQTLPNLSKYLGGDDLGAIDLVLQDPNFQKIFEAQLRAADPANRALANQRNAAAEASRNEGPGGDAAKVHDVRLILGDLEKRYQKIADQTPTDGEIMKLAEEEIFSGRPNPGFVREYLNVESLDDVGKGLYEQLGVRQLHDGSFKVVNPGAQLRAQEALASYYTRLFQRVTDEERKAYFTRAQSTVRTILGSRADTVLDAYNPGVPVPDPNPAMPDSGLSIPTPTLSEEQRQFLIGG